MVSILVNSNPRMAVIIIIMVRYYDNSVSDGQVTIEVIPSLSGTHAAMWSSPVTVYSPRAILHACINSAGTARGVQSCGNLLPINLSRSERMIINVFVSVESTTVTEL